MTRTRSIAVAQTVPVRGDIDANVAQHLQLIPLAAEQRPQVLVFPELSLTGYELDLADSLAFSLADSRLAPLRDVATSCDTALIVGAPVRIESRLHIGAFIIPPHGAPELYTKHYLGAFSAAARRDGAVPAAEATVFHPGNHNPLIRLGDSIAAVAVCADTGRPSHAQAAADRGATTYLASMFVIPSEFARDTANLERYAAQHSLTVAFANYGGPSGGLAAAGRSAIWSERGELVIRLAARGAGVASAIEDHSGWRGRALALDARRAAT
jgi:predicted amidohydrolase